ncbi:MAG: shikimate dehydrogenase, partial [Desulfovibrio sp.]|nr:shikimate dehydrogenase [Desulfovibrio sp.]
VYTPECTRFLADAAAAGWETQSGVAMFVEQARAAFALWTGQEMPEEGAYALVRAALAAK